MRKVILLLVFLLVTPLTLGVSLFALTQVFPPTHPQTLGQKNVIPSQIYAALPAEVGSISMNIETDDARPIIIEQYLKNQHSPMLPYASFIFQMSQKYNLDYRLIVAIAQCESNLCKRAPENSYNCWGFENGSTHFLSWEQAIEQVAKTLKEGYYDQGLTTPEQIMPKYAPPSVEKGGPWAKCVSQFMGELE